jgi:prefoldin subunit 5
MNEGKIIEQLTKENEQLKHDIELLKARVGEIEPLKAKICELEARLAQYEME